MADTRITDAEIAGYMGWRGPGAYTEASLRKIREIIDHVLRAERATPPSPSTAPEVDERHEFERWMSQRGESAVYIGDGLYSTGAVCDQAEAFAAGIAVARAALASRPAEVDDEGLPKLPPESARASKGEGQFYMKWSETGKDLRGELLLYTAEQYRQGQRDAVAADRARRGAAGK